MSSGQHIAIAGAGPVGAVAALALQQRGFAVTIIDRIKPMPGPHGLGMDIRNVALSQGSRQLIESLIPWPQQAGMFKTMHVWEQWGVNALNFDAAELGSDCLGWIAEVAPLLQALYYRQQSYPLLEQFLSPATSSAVNYSMRCTITSNLICHCSSLRRPLRQ